MTNELKPVPCGCGGEAKIIKDPNGFYISCKECMTETDYYDTEAKAIAVWNRAMGADKVDELMEHILRDKLDTREKIANLVERMLR